MVISKLYERSCSQPTGNLLGEADEVQQSRLGLSWYINDDDDFDLHSGSLITRRTVFEMHEATDFTAGRGVPFLSSVTKFGVYTRQVHVSLNLFPLSFLSTGIYGSLSRRTK